MKRRRGGRAPPLPAHAWVHRERAAVFLRLLYHPEEANPTTLGKLTDEMRGTLARLAHKYDVEVVLEAVRGAAHQAGRWRRPRTGSQLSGRTPCSKHEYCMWCDAWLVSTGSP